MNLLALNPRALLVERGFLARNSLNVGDPLRLDLTMGGERRTVDFIVAGVLDLFPTQYPEDGPFFVGNLAYAFQQMGDEDPYDVWLVTDGSRPAKAVVADLEEVGFRILGHDDAREIVLQEQTQPARQGLFGVLSVGFLAAAGLTVLGFLLYAVFSFRQRFIELGVLRAIGLSVGQMAAFLAGEQLALIVIGAVVGTGLGVWASRLFIPFLQVRGGQHPHTPSSSARRSVPAWGFGPAGSLSRFFKCAVVSTRTRRPLSSTLPGVTFSRFTRSLGECFSSPWLSCWCC
jgi:putative ABC transport system permease protein